jgi:hypothetical protein
MMCGLCLSLSLSLSLLSGDTIVAVDSPFGRLGLTVCYDLRFPELYQILRFKHQAQVVMHSNILYKLYDGNKQLHVFWSCFNKFFF